VHAHLVCVCVRLDNQRMTSSICSRARENMAPLRMCHAFNQYLVVAVKNKGLYGSKPYTP
jgi:hypothetical protein